MKAKQAMNKIPSATIKYTTPEGEFTVNSDDCFQAPSPYDSIPDGDPGKAWAAFIALSHGFAQLSCLRRQGLKQLNAWAAIEKQTLIAKKLGITPQYLSDVLNGRRELSEAVCRRAIKALAPLKVPPASKYQSREA